MSQNSLYLAYSNSEIFHSYLYSATPFFPTLEEANLYLDTKDDKTGMMVRPSNLEDIFVELTGRQLD